MCETFRLYVHSPRWFIRPQNTDWRYTRFVVPGITEYAPEIQFALSSSFATTIKANWGYAQRTIRRRLGHAGGSEESPSIDMREYRRTHCDAVFCHDGFPRGTGDVPVVWQNSLLDPAMMRAGGLSETEFQQIREEKARGFEAASLIMVSTEAEKARLSKAFPQCAGKFAAVPFFLPATKAISPDDLERKLLRSGPLRLLFVGNEARRKGLERVYQAFLKLEPSLRDAVELTVVSAQTDGTIAAPPLRQLRVLGRRPHAEVQELMRNSDALLVPSFFESYGFVYLEAMAQGAIPVVPDWEVQREIVDYGRAGITTTGDPVELAQLIERLHEDRRWARNLAVEAAKRYVEFYSPAVVAGLFRDALRTKTWN